MSIGRCGASWAASSATRAPCRRATSATRATGHTSPVTLDAPVTTTSRGPTGQARSARSSSASAASTAAGVAIRCTFGPRHGSSAAWCSVSNSTTDVPEGTALASRFSESVVLRVTTTASPRRAPTKARSACLACSYTAVHTWEA